MAAGFACPTCASRTLAVAAAIELPPDEDSDEVQVQLLSCASCGLAAVGLYEESRRGASDRCRHEGYLASDQALSRIRQLIGVCPTPRERACGCATHRLLGAPGGLWREMRGIGITAAKRSALL